MNVTSITVRRLETGNGYNNVAHEMTVAIDLAAGDDVEALRNEADLQVQAWNEGTSIDQLRFEYNRLDFEVSNLGRRKTELEFQVEELKRRVATMKGTPLEQLIAADDGMPF